MGGSIQIFNLNEKKIDNNKLASSSKLSSSHTAIIEDQNKNTYIITGSRHLMSRSEIYRINHVGKIDSISIVVSPEMEADTVPLNISISKKGYINVASERRPIILQNTFISCGVFNPKDSSLYFSSFNGIYKVKTPLASKTEFPENIIYLPELNPKTATTIDPNNIEQMHFLDDNTQIMLIRYQGIALYKDNRIKLLK